MQTQIKKILLSTLFVFCMAHFGPAVADPNIELKHDFFNIKKPIKAVSHSVHALKLGYAGGEIERGRYCTHYPEDIEGDFVYALSNEFEPDIWIEGTTIPCTADLPLMLPVGSHITNIDVFYFDTTISNDPDRCVVTALLNKTPIDSPRVEVIQEVEARGNTASVVQSLSLDGTDIEAGHRYSLFLKIVNRVKDWGICNLQGVKVEYRD